MLFLNQVKSLKFMKMLSLLVKFINLSKVNIIKKKKN